MLTGTNTARKICNFMMIVWGHLGSLLLQHHQFCSRFSLSLFLTSYSDKKKFTLLQKMQKTSKIIFKMQEPSLNLTSKLPQVRNVSFAHLLNQTLMTLHGIPKNADMQKRQVAQILLSNYKDFQIIIFVMPKGDIYFDEPYSRPIIYSE
jgi:hypothetical protein